MSLDRVPHPVEACYPAQNQEVFTRLRHAALFRDAVDLRERPAEAAGTVLRAAAFHVEARPLSHTIPVLGYRLVAADGRRMLPDRLAAFGITGPDIGRLQREGRLVTRGAPGDSGPGERAEAGPAFRVHHGHPAVRCRLRAR